MLLHSPLTSALTWGTLPEKLRAAGYHVVVPDVRDDNRPPFDRRYVLAVTATVRDEVQVSPTGGTADSGGLLLVAHSGAGPLLPQVGASCRAVGQVVAGYVFCDAGLPRPGASRLDLLQVENPSVARSFAEHLEAGGLYPEWTFEELAETVPDADARRELLAGLRPRGLGFFTEEIGVPDEWPEAPCGYLRTSATYDVHAREAGQLGWPVRAFGEGHFAALVDPEGLAAALTELARSM